MNASDKLRLNVLLYLWPCQILWNLNWSLIVINANLKIEHFNDDRKIHRVILLLKDKCSLIFGIRFTLRLSIRILFFLFRVLNHVCWQLARNTGYNCDKYLEKISFRSLIDRTKYHLIEFCHVSWFREWFNPSSSSLEAWNFRFFRHANGSLTDAWNRVHFINLAFHWRLSYPEINFNQCTRF